MRKTCAKCGELKPISAFRDGRNQCKLCRYQQQKLYRRTDKGKAARKRERQKRIESGVGKSYQCKHRAENKSVYNERRRAYRASSLRGSLERTFSGVKSRCLNPKCGSYKSYGGIGIELRFTYCQLLDWCVKNGVDPIGKQIHRVNNNGHYELNNIIFVAAKEHRELHV